MAFLLQHLRRFILCRVLGVKPFAAPYTSVRYVAGRHLQRRRIALADRLERRFLVRVDSEYRGSQIVYYDLRYKWVPARVFVRAYNFVVRDHSDREAWVTGKRHRRHPGDVTIIYW